MTNKNEHVRSLEMTVLMTPDMVNFSGKIHGGAILKLIDQVAYACASRYCGHYVVTLSVDQVFFRYPILVGELVTFFAKINYTSRSSMEVGIKIVSENIHSRTKRHVLSSYCTMVAVDENSKSIPVVPLIIETEEDKLRFEKALQRKKLRDELWKK